MKNQLRSGFYLLVRNPYVWVALALVVVRWAWTLAGVAQGSVSFGLQDSILRDKVTLAVYVFSAAGIAAFDQRGRALRSSCEAEGGRARYATSRFVMVAVVALVLVAVTAALDLLGGALVPGASRIVASPQMHEPLRLAAGILTVLVACELAFFVGALVRSPSALATVALLAVLYVLFHMAIVALVPDGEITLQQARLLDAVGALVPTEGLTTGVSFAPEARLMPLDLVPAFVTPLVWLAALFGLTRLLLARRTV